MRVKDKWVFIKSYNATNFDNSPTIEVGTILEQCEDGWFQYFSPDGVKISGRVSPVFIEKNKGNLIIKKELN